MKKEITGYVMDLDKKFESHNLSGKCKKYKAFVLAVYQKPIYDNMIKVKIVEVGK